MPSLNPSVLERFARSPLPVFVLVAIAGHMDALAMLHSKEWLAVYMTGNSTKLSQSLLHGALSKALPLLAVIASFLASTTFAAWLGSRFPRWRASLCMVLTAAFLAAVVPNASEHYTPFSTSLIAASMGAMNQALADQPGVTFITGTVVGIGRQLAACKFNAAAVGMLRWFAWIAGAAVGTSLDFLYGPEALAFVALAALVCALAAALHGTAVHPRQRVH